MSAVAYQIVNRPRMLAMSGAYHVSHAAHRVNQLGFFGVIDLLAQPGDDHVHDVRAGIEVIIPGVFGDQRAGHHPALMAHQVLEHGVFLRRELDALAVAGDLATARVEDEPVYLELRRGDRLGPPSQGLNAREPQPFIAVADEIDMIAGLIQPTANVLPDRSVVLNDQDLHAIGRKTLKLVPTPTWDSTSMRPRCSSTMPYATDRPSPVPRPCGFVVKNGSKIFGRSSCWIPVPVSMNSARISSARCGLRRVRTVSTPREFIASMAFSISAMKHCTSRSASAGNGGRPCWSSRSIVSHLNRS